MDDTRDSDIIRTNIDLVDSSTSEPFSLTLPIEDDSMHPIGPKGFCVKEYEEQMQELKKENFNLKLKIYMLEARNPNMPEGADALYKENIDLKVEHETLIGDLNEKQNLLLEASKALDLLDKQKNEELKRAQVVIDELHQKVESLEHEVNSLQNALSEANKNSMANDTGYADFIGAVDPREIECQKKLQEIREIEENFTHQMTVMNEKMIELQAQKKEIEMQASNLLYENDEMKDKMAQVAKQFSDQQSRLESELNNYKEKWAASQCDLQDCESKLVSVEKERDKMFVVLNEALESVEKKRMKINDLENQVSEAKHAGNTSKNDSEVAEQRKLLKMKENEIAELKDELFYVKRQVQLVSVQELNEKNRQIEKLSNLVKNLQTGRDSVSAYQNRLSLEQLSESFNELKFQQAMEEKKRSQEVIDHLMQDLVDTATSTAKEHFIKLQTEMANVVEKQEVTDNALGKCAEICVCTLDHLHELANFLRALLQQQEIKDSLNETTFTSIKNLLDSTLEFSNQASRYSIDGRMSLPDISSLDILMTSARVSIANIREIQNSSKSIQESYDDKKEELEREFLSVKRQLEETVRVNETLEDEVCQLKQSMENYKAAMQTSDSRIEELKEDKNYLSVQLQDAETQIEELHGIQKKLEKQLMNVAAEHNELESKFAASETLAEQLQQKLETLAMDVETFWIKKDEHESVVQRLKDDIISGEAQVAAIRMEMDSLKDTKAEFGARSLDPIVEEFKNLEIAEQKENFKPIPARRTLDISEDRKRMLESSATSTVSLMSDAKCPDCPKYQAKIVELKKYLHRAMDKIKIEHELKAHNERHIQQQLSSTEKFLHKARNNMENVLKTRNAQ